MNRDLQQIVRELEQSGVPHKIEKGTRHLKIFVGGKLAGILPKRSSKTSNIRAQLNVRAQVRRAIKDEARNNKSAPPSQRTG